MGLNIECPPVFPTLSNQTCEFNFGQILRLAVGEIGSATFADETAFGLSANWSALVGTDDIQYTPLTNNVVIPGGEAATIGPDTNETFFGELKVVGKTSINVVGRFQGLEPAIKAELDGLIGVGASFGNLGVYFIDEHGKIFGDQVGAPGSTVTPIPVSSFFVGDPGSEGYNTLTYTAVSFNLKPGWFNSIIDVAPDFDPILAIN